ncbi:MAG TPA: hypothetical protein VEZ41_00555 [Allosphingosinicella sp.]|jgi:hypothetical protein|nr:hypothetical protein [Allosphingosinicella sp.]
MDAVRSAAFAAAAAASLSLAVPAAAQDADAEARLDRTIDAAMEADGPWLLPAEQALITRKCGYAPGSRGGESVTMNDGVLICANGRRVDDPEVRAMMRVAGPRIARRVHAVMASPAVKNALSLVVDGAVERALENLREELPRRSRRR